MHTWESLFHSRNFYPRSPCGERLLSHYPCDNFCDISIHALLAESDRPTLCPLHRQQHFYPRSPCGERRSVVLNTHKRHIQISIHALLAESDTALCRFNVHTWDFYPRSPCGERPPLSEDLSAIEAFLSTLSLRRATLSKYACRIILSFLSTLSLRRATV